MFHINRNLKIKLYKTKRLLKDKDCNTRQRALNNDNKANPARR